MHRSPILWFVIGWLVSMFFPPSTLFGMFKGVVGGA